MPSMYLEKEDDGRLRTARQRNRGGVRDEKTGRRYLLLAPVVKYVE
jgi:hypothetical protein